jgi:predicted transcriptional regulator
MATKTETISIKVSPEDKQKIKELAAKQDITVSKLLYKLIFKQEEK